MNVNINKAISFEKYSLMLQSKLISCILLICPAIANAQQAMPLRQCMKSTGEIVLSNIYIPNCQVIGTENSTNTNKSSNSNIKKRYVNEEQTDNNPLKHSKVIQNYGKESNQHEIDKPSQAKKEQFDIIYNEYTKESQKLQALEARPPALNAKIKTPYKFEYTLKAPEQHAEIARTKVNVESLSRELGRLNVPSLKMK